MPAPWRQAVDNANDYSSNIGGRGQNFTAGIDPATLARLKAMGIDTGGIESIGAWQNSVHPIRSQQDLGTENRMYNEGRNQVVDALQQGNQHLAAGQLNQTGQFMQDSRAQLGQQLNQAGQGYYDAGQRITQGYGRAQNEVNQLGRAQQGNLLDREKVQNSGAMNDLRSRGLNSTTVGINAKRGIAADTNRGLNDNSERMAGLRSGLIAQGTNARAGADSQLNNFMANRANAEYGAGQDQANFMTRRTGIETGLADQRINTLNNNRFQYDPSNRLAQNAAIGGAYPHQQSVLSQIGSGLVGTAAGAFGTALGQGIFNGTSNSFGDLFKGSGGGGGYGPRYPGQKY